MNPVPTKLVALLFALLACLLVSPAAEARRQKGPTAQQIAAAREAAGDVLALDFRQTDRVVLPAEVVRLYDEACAAGYQPICSWRSWHFGHDTTDIKAAAAHFEPLCEAGDPLGCVVSGWYLSQVRGVPRSGAKDPAGAAERFSRACTAGFGRGCWELGRLYESGVGVAMDSALAADVYDRACKAGFERGCFAVGELRLYGLGVPRDVPAAIAGFAAACEGGSGLGCAAQARARRLGFDTSASAESTAMLLEAQCKRGSQGSCAELGVWLAAGRGLPRDTARAATLFQRACDYGEMRGCFNLGSAFLKGEGVVGNTAQGRARWSQACDGGLVEACFQLANFHTSGAGTPEDAANGLTLLERGCAKGHQPSCGLLGQRLLATGGAETERATALLKRACAADEGEACRALAGAYAHGKGVERDLPRAIQLLEPRCANDTSATCVDLASFYLAPTTRQGANPQRAVTLYAGACEAGRIDACGPAAEALAAGALVAADLPRAVKLARVGCAVSDPRSCTVLVKHSAAAGLPPEEVASLARGACDRASAEACAVHLQLAAAALPALPAPPPVRRGAPPPPPPLTAEARVIAALRDGCTAAKRAADCTTLAAHLLTGVGVPVDEVEARRTFERACTSRDAVACGNVGWMAMAGRGGRADLDQALVTLRAACQGGDQRACEQVQGLVTLPR